MPINKESETDKHWKLEDYSQYNYVFEGIWHASNMLYKVDSAFSSLN